MAVNTDGLAADGSAMLDVASTSKGMLVPRMTSSARNGITNPAKGLLVYQTDAPEGFYYNSGTSGVPAWVSLSSLTGAGLVPTSAMPALTGDVTTSAGAVATTLGSSAATGNRVVAAINAASTGTIGSARLGSGTPSSSTFLNGDGAWTTPLTLTTTGSGAASFSAGVLNIPTPSGGSGSVAPAVITDAGASPVTADFSGSTTAKVFIFNRGATTGVATVNIKLPASGNFSDGDIVTIALGNKDVSNFTFALQMSGCTALYNFGSTGAQDISSSFITLSASSTSGLKLIKANSTTWYRIP